MKGDRGWEKGEGGRMERGGRKWGRQEIKPKGKKEEKGERSRGREKEEVEWEKTTTCPSPHRFREV